MREDLADGLFAQVRVTARERDLGDRAGRGLVQPPVIQGLLPYYFRVFSFEQEPHDVIALIERELKPAIAEHLLLGPFLLPPPLHETGGCLLAFDRVAATASEVEGGARWEPEVPRGSRRLFVLAFPQGDVLARPESLQGARSLVGFQRPLRFESDPEFQVVDLLEHSELLGDRQRAGGPVLAFLEQAPSGIDGFERALEEDDVLKRVPLVGSQHGVMGCLGVANRVEFSLVQGPVGVKT